MNTHECHWCHQTINFLEPKAKMYGWFFHLTCLTAFIKKLNADAERETK